MFLGLTIKTKTFNEHVRYYSLMVKEFMKDEDVESVAPQSLVDRVGEDGFADEFREWFEGTGMSVSALCTKLAEKKAARAEAEKKAATELRKPTVLPTRIMTRRGGARAAPPPDQFD